MNPTPISWCTHTANHQAGCSPISRACDFCYAGVASARFALNPKAPSRYRAEGVAAWRGAIALDADWRERLRGTFQGIQSAQKPRRVWIGSMTDLWHQSIPIDAPQLAALAEEIRKTFPHNTRQAQTLILLTKRPGRMMDWQRHYFPAGLPVGVEVGTTLDNQEQANKRLPYLLQVTAHLRFVSCEPLLGPLDLRPYLDAPGPRTCAVCGGVGALEGVQQYLKLHGEAPRCLLGHTALESRIHLVVTGGESGPRARPSHPEWFRSLREQCEEAGALFHHKQHGELGSRAWLPSDYLPGEVAVTVYPDGRCLPGAQDTADGGEWMWRVGRSAAGRLLDGVLHDALPSR